MTRLFSSGVTAARILLSLTHLEHEGYAAAEMKTFFVLALGRSGTNFLASLLASDTRGVVHHEPSLWDHKLAGLRHAGTFDSVLDALLEARFAPLLADAGDVEFYGEVNSYLRYEVDWLRRRFDPALIHLVRDGRDFVRSAYVRDLFTADEAEVPVLPRDDDPAAASWNGMTRFEKLCWYWAHTNEFLAGKLDHPVRFELLLKDYAYFEEHVLKPTGVRIDRERWQHEVTRPKNTTRRFRLRQAIGDIARNRKRDETYEPIPRWREWDADRTDRFWEICGPTMQKLGYER